MFQHIQDKLDAIAEVKCPVHGTYAVPELRESTIVIKNKCCEELLRAVYDMQNGQSSVAFRAVLRKSRK